jgi:hypothetical protein
MWSLGVLLVVLLTGISPPFAHYMVQTSCLGLCIEQLQQGVMDCLHRVLDARAMTSPVSHSAQVAVSCPSTPYSS